MLIKDTDVDDENEALLSDEEKEERSTQRRRTDNKKKDGEIVAKVAMGVGAVAGGATSVCAAEGLLAGAVAAEAFVVTAVGVAVAGAALGGLAVAGAALAWRHHTRPSNLHWCSNPTSALDTQGTLVCLYNPIHCRFIRILFSKVNGHGAVLTDPTQLPRHWTSEHLVALSTGTFGEVYLYKPMDRSYLALSQSQGIYTQKRLVTEECKFVVVPHDDDSQTMSLYNTKAQQYVGMKPDGTMAAISDEDDEDECITFAVLCFPHKTDGYAKVHPLKIPHIPETTKEQQQDDSTTASEEPSTPQ
uniref:Uncharacterized protein n=1 Tax=Attheya septentrionalis TaxID=420275 RepID=A0A7S2XPY6_9STRA|mmetsp:Transcript_2586/g.4682  ORF Transcript_2586/g.4682 Transcript_2586/m.4682 type:complete len:302 (+) Transcript_2586:144-1049(+)|eukprot:CAMPEP_0198304896 /NCGR_PEP_ID=MMETSP1449-20131203/57632_1 /TAXON_ID=420275 /ORGANISM="Attheya septentrionalis, Strain CCMP2084" /LENGTH=301 /DNA_ID=CAMNT_0044007425 /DNA_START=118 /DNA_END=1023 /DNA_ORIENTATION=+